MLTTTQNKFTQKLYISLLRMSVLEHDFFHFFLNKFLLTTQQTSRLLYNCKLSIALIIIFYVGFFPSKDPMDSIFLCDLAIILQVNSQIRVCLCSVIIEV